MTSLTIRRPDDWHLHLRDGAALAAVAPFTAAQFGRAIVMPNLPQPITSTRAAIEYRQRIMQALPQHPNFQPLMTLYLSDATRAADIDEAMQSGIVYGVKLYPAGATTHSDRGVSNLAALSDVFERMQRLGMPLLVHGEVTDPQVDIFDREACFIDRHLAPLVERFATLKIVFEHITTARAVEFVRQARPGVGATITPQHLLHNRNAIFSGGIRPHYYCLPILKRESDRLALLAAATSGSDKFFLGTDSAPHERGSKESACGCAGVFTAHAAIELYAEAFDEVDKLERLESFASEFGPKFYNLPPNGSNITLIKNPWQVPEHYPFGDGRLIPYRAGATIPWRLAHSNA